MALAVLGTAFGLAPFFIVYKIAVLAAADALETPTLFGWTAAAFAAIALKGALQAAASYVSHIAAYDVLHALRVALVEKLDRLPLGFVTSRSTAELKKTIHEDVEQIEDAIAHAAPDIASALAVPVVSAAMLAFVDWRLACAAFAMFPALVVVYPLTLIAVKALNATYMEALTSLKHATLQYIRGIKVIRAFLNAEAPAKALEEGVDRLEEATLRLSTAALGPGALLYVGLRANILVLIPVGGFMHLSGAADAPTFVLFLLVGLGMTAPVQKLLMTAGAFAWRLQTAGKQIFAVLDAPELSRAETPRTPSGYDVAFHDVSFRYGEHATLEKVDFVARRGAVTAIVGPSGAGKSTIARLGARFWDVDEGAVTIGGVDIRDIAPETLAKTVSFVLQDAWLFNDTIRANIRSGRPEASDAEIEDAARRAQVTPFAQELPGGLDAGVGEGGRGLSGGQRQRVAIARAILRDSPIVVLDEATSALDPDNEAQVLRALSELVQGRTVIAIAHRLDTIRGADQILYVDAGRIAARGGHLELLRSFPPYARLCEAYEASEGWSLPGAAASAPTATPVGVAAARQGDPEPAEPPFAGAGVLKLFLRLAGPMRGALVRQALPLLFLEGLMLGAPVVATVLTLRDVFAGTLTSDKVWLYTGIVAGCFVGQAIVNVLANRTLWKVQSRAAASLQRKLARHLRRIPLGVLTSRDSGALEHIVIQNTTELSFVQPPAQVMRVLVAPTLAFVVMLAIDWRLALAAAATLPLFVLAVAWGDRVFRSVVQETNASKETLASRTIDHLQGVATIRSLGLGGLRHKALSDAFDRHRDLARATLKRLTPTVATGSTLLDLGFCAILLVGGLLVSSGSLALPTLLLFLVVGLVFYGPISDAFELVSQRRQLELGMRRIGEIMDLPPLPEPSQPKVPTNLDIEFAGVGFSYGDRRALSGLDVLLPAGRLHAFVGGSGSGKTTALNLLARFWDVDEGAIRIGGVDLRRMSSATRAGLFSIVFQDTFLFDDTIAGNLRLAKPEATQAELEAAARAARCHDFIAALEHGYESRVGEGGALLSGGERQRIAIARAILKDAPIVLLDEATASIDPGAEHEIRQALAAVCAGKTVIVVAHRLRSVAAADQIVVFDKGRVVGRGVHDELLGSCPAYAALTNAQGAAGDGQSAGLRRLRQGATS
ncbi:ABC transporter ATP-binding protein [Methylopila musalis]|uniref:ABC transporter ATP-binding protein n=1 Tax=Methylopila musalis TaxID=1134781 RepID=UPI00366E6C85